MTPGKVRDLTDEQIVAALNRGVGGRAYQIAYRLEGARYTTAFCRSLHRRLRKLEAAGKVHRCPRYSAVNSIYWRAGPV